MRQAGKHFQAISHLPDNPRKRIYWIVYNSDMIKYVETLIKEIKGQEYLDNNVTVVSKSDPSHDRAKGTIYFDPSLLDLLGNGNV
jgi:hypothetical protein